MCVHTIGLPRLRNLVNVYTSSNNGNDSVYMELPDLIFIPRHTLVSGYYVIPFGVCPSPFPIDNLSIYSRNFFKFCIHNVIGNEWYGIVNGQNPSIFNGYCPFSYWKNGFWPVIPLLFMISE